MKTTLDKRYQRCINQRYDDDATTKRWMNYRRVKQKVLTSVVDYELTILTVLTLLITLDKR